MSGDGLSTGWANGSTRDVVEAFRETVREYRHRSTMSRPPLVISAYQWTSMEATLAADRPELTAEQVEAEVTLEATRIARSWGFGGIDRIRV